VKPEGKGVALTMAINGRLLFTIAPIKQDAKSSKKTKVDLNFSLDPPRVEVKDVICGKRVKILTDEKKPILIKNTTNVKMKFLLQSLDPQETVISLEPNYEACPSPDYLTFKHEKITIGKGREKPLEMYLEIPDKPEYKKKRFQFLVSVATGTATSGSRYLRVLVSTAGD
ncbi:hypothetical protein KAR10_05245, partial [bacterium]|nr:hypothetical protein [bacterium]